MTVTLFLKAFLSRPISGASVDKISSAEDVNFAKEFFAFKAHS